MKEREVKSVVNVSVTPMLRLIISCDTPLTYSSVPKEWKTAKSRSLVNHYTQAQDYIVSSMKIKIASGVNFTTALQIWLFEGEATKMKFT